jgi:hypothetical protein
MKENSGEAGNSASLFFALGEVSCFSLFFHDLFRIVALCIPEKNILTLQAEYIR